MSKTQLIRKSFNAGELSPELHYRDDLEAYVKGCKHLTNMTPTPYGAVTRRPPFEVLSKIDTARYGVPVRYIPFKFSLTEIFHIVFTDGSGSMSVDSSTADLIIFDKTGGQVIFDGTADIPLSELPLTLDGTTLEGPSTLNTGFVAMANTVYDPTDLHKIHFINVNDFVYLTCGGEYPVQSINRFFDESQGSNRWKISPLDIKGLVGLENDKADLSITASQDQYDPAFSYAEGDMVSPAEIDLAMSSAGLRYLSTDGIGRNIYRLKINTSTAHGFVAGSRVNVDGIRISSNDSGLTVYASTLGRLVVGKFIKGSFSVAKVYSSTQFDLNLSFYKPSGQGAADATFTVADGKFYEGVAGGKFYRSLSDGNVGNALSDSSKWDQIDTYQGEISLNSSLDLFAKTDVGRTVGIKIDTSNELNGSWDASTTSKAIQAQGVVELKTEGGAWGGQLDLQSSNDSGQTWVTINSIWSKDGSTNSTFETEVTEIDTLLRVQLNNWSAPSGTFNVEKCIWKLIFTDVTRVYFEISEFIDEQKVKAFTKTPIFGEITDSRFSLGEFSDTTGYPYSLTIHDERLCLGGSKDKPNTVFASRVNDWNNFLEGTTELSPYTFTIASDSFDTIRSLKSSRQLNIMTDNAENTMGSRDDNAVTSVTNISVSSHTNYGSNEVQAIQMADMIWFVMGQGERVRASKYDFASDGQQSIEMSLFSSHITESGIKEMGYRRHPYNSLFCLLNNGTACTLTYEGMQEVRAWATVKTAGNIISASSNYSDNGDIIAGIVERNGSYFLEQFGDIDDNTVFLDNQTCWQDADFITGQPFVQDDDGGLVVVYNDRELVRDIDYVIEGQMLRIITSTEGTNVLPANCGVTIAYSGYIGGRVCLGRRIECRVNPTDISEVAPSGMVKRLTELGLYLIDSGTCDVEINGKPSPFTDGLKWKAGQRESGLFELTTGGDYEQGLDVNITIDNHRHFTLTGLGYRLGISQG